MPKKLFVTSSIFISVLVLLALVIPNVTLAQERIFNPPKVIFEDEQDSFDLDIRRTVMNMVITSAMDGIDYPSTELETSEKMGCLGYIENLMQEDLPSRNLGISGTQDQANTTDPRLCEGLINTYNEATISGTTTINEEMATAKTAGSLVGLGHLAENMTYQDMPVSLKYYASRQVENVPFMGTAMAQGILESTVGGVTYAGPFLAFTYDIWRVFRNMAYGAMAIVMIAVGIMIMTRKRLNPQTAVTVQYAIPRIVVALVLITFSYPIGATIASLAWALKFSVDNIILEPAVASGEFALLASARVIGSIGVQGMLVMMAAYWLLPGVGLLGFALVTIASVIAFAAWLIVIVKILIIYIKMLIQIVIAPFQFALGAIPGHDDSIKNWFKKMIAYALAIFAMSITMGFTKIFAGAIIIQLMDSGGTVNLPLIAFFAGPPLVAFVLVFGFNEARKMDKRVMEAIMGKPRR